MLDDREVRKGLHDRSKLVFCCEHVTLTRFFFFERRRREGYDAMFVLKLQTIFATRGAMNSSIPLSRDQLAHA